MAAAALGGISITLSKVSVLLVRTSIEGSNQLGTFSHGSSSVLISCAVLNLKVLNEGLAQFEAMLVIPILVVSTLLTCLPVSCSTARTVTSPAPVRPARGGRVALPLRRVPAGPPRPRGRGDQARGR